MLPTAHFTGSPSTTTRLASRDWVVDAAERHVKVGIGADAGIALLARIGSAEARAALSRLATKPGGLASWDDAEAARDALRELEKRDEGG
jgi:hypothetical protein